MKWFLSLILPVWLLAVPLKTLIENAKSHHISLKSIEQRVSAIDDELSISQNFSDPIVSLSVSDIQLDDIGDRSIEPMQYAALNVQQKIPYFGKRVALLNKIKAKKAKVTLSLDAMKVKLVREIKTMAYSIWQREEELKITDAYIKLTKQNIELYSAFTSSDSVSHMSIMSAEMALSELKIKKSRLNSVLKGLYKKLTYFSQMEVQSVEMPMRVYKPKEIQYYTQIKSTNISYKIKEATLDEAREDIKVKEINSLVDPIVKVGYYQRRSYEDYINIGVAFSLPVYGTQDAMTQKARKLALASKSEIADFERLLLSDIAKVYAKLEASYAVHNIIEHQSMPQIEHMFELSSSSIKSGDELFLYIELLAKKLSLDEKNIAVIAEYHRNLATLDALVGEMQ